MTAQYAARDIESLDKFGGHYSRHVDAMTAEDLHDKSEIAAELAFRDAKINMLSLQVESLLDDVYKMDSAIHSLRYALNELVRINEVHNERVAGIIGRPSNWKDDYLDGARKVLKETE